MEYFIAFVLILNTIFLFGVAGTVAKILKYLQSEEDSKEEWAGIIRNRRVLDTQERPANYADSIGLNTSENRPPNWDGLAKTSRNWDGIPNKKD